MPPIGQSTFRRLFKVHEKQHDSFEGLLRQPIVITGELAGGFVGRRGRPVRYDASTGTYNVLIAAKVLSADIQTGRLKLSHYDGVSTGNARGILSNGNVVTINITQLQGPVFDPVSTLQTNDDFVVVADPDGSGPLTVRDIRYIAPATATFTTRATGIIQEDSRDFNAPVAVEVDGARVEHVFGADIPAIAAALGFQVVGGLVFFRLA